MARLRPGPRLGFCARALQKLGDRQGAVALLEDLSGVSTNLEKTSRLYQAKQIKTP